MVSRHLQLRFLSRSTRVTAASAEVSLHVCATGVDVLPTLRVLYAEIAACCSSMASAMKFRRGLQNVSWMDSFRTLCLVSQTARMYLRCFAIQFCTVLLLSTRPWHRRADIPLRAPVRRRVAGVTEPPQGRAAGGAHQPELDALGKLEYRLHRCPQLAGELPYLRKNFRISGSPAMAIHMHVGRQILGPASACLATITSLQRMPATLLFVSSFCSSHQVYNISWVAALQCTSTSAYA
jgi:hypothetical protein